MTMLAALAVAIVFASGTYLLLQRDLMRVIVGVILVSNSAVLFLISAGLTRGEAPIYPLPESMGEGTESGVSDPLVQAMALTALVIGFGVAALLMAMVYRLYAAHGTIDAEEIAESEVDQAEAWERVGEPPEYEELPANELEELEPGSGSGDETR